MSHMEKSYQNLPQYIEERYRDKMILLQGAKRSLKKRPEFQNVEKVFEGIDALAAYHDMKTGRISRNRFMEMLEKSRLGLNTYGKETPTMRSEQYVHVYEGVRYYTYMHLCYGKSRDPRKTMRIYFAYDEKNQKVIIGSLPAHLITRQS